MNISLTTLAATDSELTTEQLDEVDGGLIVIMCLAVFNIALYSYGIGTLNPRYP